MQRTVDKKQRQVCRKKQELRYTVIEVRKMNFGIKLQMLRKDKRMSQEALAEQLGVSRQAVSKWETGEGYPETETIITISNLFGVSLDYLMKENQGEGMGSITEDSVVLSTTELEDFLNFKRKLALIIATAVGAIIASVSLHIFYEDEVLATGAMMLIIAIAVGSMIIIGILSNKYEYLEKKHIILKPVDLDSVKDKQKKYRITFAVMIAAGVFLIIAATAMIAVFDRVNPKVSGYFLWAVAIAVFMFIYAGIIDGSYHQICDTKEFVKEVKDNEESGKYYAVTMPLAAMGYLVLGFIYGLWHPGWLIFPVVAILTFAFTELKK